MQKLKSAFLPLPSFKSCFLKEMNREVKQLYNSFKSFPNKNKNGNDKIKKNRNDLF